MQRGTRVGSDSSGPAARKAARPSSTGINGSAPAGGGGRAIRSRTASEKNPESSTRAKAAGISKPARRAAKPFTSIPDPTPVTHKRLPTVQQQKKVQSVSVPDFSSSNQDEPQCDGEDAEVARDDASDPATVNWILSGDYRLVTAVRVRPMLPSEKKKGYRRIVEMAPPDDGGWTRIVNPVALTMPLSPLPDENGDSPAVSALPSTNKQFTHEFAFDHSFWSYDHAAARQVATQSVVYESLGGLAIETVLQGFNCSILAYGQSGTGKTFTMMGSSTTAKVGMPTSGNSTRATSRTASRSTGNGSTTSGNAVASRRGLMPRICQGLFDRLEELQQDFGDKSSVYVSYVEIFNERVFDLLPALANSKKSLEPLKVREHPEQGTYVENARQVRATTFEAIQTLLEDGNRQRSVATTTVNSRSSRSHTILMLTLAHQTPPPLSAGKEGHSPSVKKSKLYLVDLAGSERSDTTDTNSSRQRESNIINKSLATLADVISALTKQRATGNSNNISAGTSAPFVPYRNSVLTRLLKESLGGDATTVLLATISPCCAHFEDSLSTLKFIGRAKSALSVPKLPSSPASTLLSSNSVAIEQTTGLDLVHELQKEIVELKDKLNAPPPVNEARRPSFTLAWESPSPDSIVSRCKKSSPDNQSFAQKTVDSSAAGPSQLRDELDPLKAAMQWAMQTEASPLSPKPEIQSSREDATKVCNSEYSLEQELTSLQLLLSRKETPGTVESPRRLEVTRDLLSQVRALGNVVAIYRRFVQLRTFRAFLKWRIHSKPTLRIQDTSVQTETPSPNGITKLQEVQPLDTLCRSIVNNFVFSTSDNEATSTVGPSSLEVSDIEQQEIDSNTLSIIIDEYDELSALEGDSPQEEDNTSAPSSKGVATDRQQCIMAKLASCLDSIDLARKALGPTLRRLRDIATRIGRPTIAFPIATEEERSSIGIEQNLLVHIDKILFSVSQYIDTMQNRLAQRSDATITHGVAATAVFELMEALIGAFCMHMMGRVNDQLVSGSSGCSIGRLELESQLQTFREQLLQLVQLANVIMARGELHPREHDVILLVVLELTALCERVKCVWHAIEQRKRHQLINRRLTSASAEALDCLNAKLRSAESKAKAYGESLDSKVLEIARAEEELAGAMEKLNRMEEDHANHIATLEIQLAETESRVTEFEQNSLTAGITCKTQSIRIEELELQLDELNKNLQTLKDGQDGILPGDETSPITLRCGNLMVRLEEELTSALSRMNAMEVPNVPLDSVEARCMDPETSEYSLSDEAFNVHRELEADIGDLCDDQYATGERFSIQTQEIVSAQKNDHEDVGKIKAAMERDLLAASVHEHELETQLSDAMSQVCHLQTQHDALVRSVQSLNNELSEALERIAFLEDEKLQLEHRSVDAKADAEDKIEDDHQLGFTIRDESIQVEHNWGLSRGEEELTCNKELAKHESDIQRYSSTIDLQVLCEESQHAPAFEQADGTLVEDSRESERDDWTTHEKVHEITVSKLSIMPKRAHYDLSNYKGQYSSASQETNESYDPERDPVGITRVDLEARLADERARNIEHTREAELASQNFEEQFSKANALMAQFEASASPKQQCEVQVLAKEAELSSNNIGIPQLQEDVDPVLMRPNQNRQDRAVEQEDAVKQLRILVEKVRELEELLLTENSTIHQREVDICSLRADATSKSALIESREEKGSNTCTITFCTIERLKAEIAAKNSEADRARKQCYELSKTLEMEQDRRENLQGELYERDEMLCNLQKQLDKFECSAGEEILNKDKLIAAMQTELEWSALKLQEFECKMSNAEKAHKSVTCANSELEMKAEGLVRAIACLENTLCLERNDLEAVRRELREARASLISSTIKLGASRAMCRSLEQLCEHETVRNSEFEGQCAEYQNKLAATLSVQTRCEQWKCAWADAIVQCGSLKAALSSAHTRNEDLEKLMLHESSIARQFAGKLESLELELLESEQTKAEAINKFDILGKEMIQHRYQSDEMRTKIDELEALDRQREAEFMELQLLHNLTDQEKRCLEGSYEQSEILMASVEKKLKLLQELLSVREMELDTIRTAKAELDEKMATLQSSAKGKDDEWRQKESILLDELNQTKQLLEDAKESSVESSHCLKVEQARVLELQKQVNYYQENEKEQVEISSTLKLQNEELKTSISAKEENLQYNIAELQILAAEHKLLMQQLAMSVADQESWCNYAKTYKLNCSNREEECDKLRLSLTTLQSEVLRLRDVTAASATRVASQDCEITRLRNDLQEATEKNKRLEDAHFKLEGKLHHQVLLNQGVQAEIRENLVQLENFETANTELKLQKESMYSEMKTIMENSNIYGARALEAEQTLANVEASLQHELEHSKELMEQLKKSRSDLAGRDTSLQVMAERIAHLNKIMASQRSSHEELIGECASLAQQNKLLRNQIGEEKETSLMTFEELESFRSYIVAHPETLNRMQSALLLDQTVYGYSDAPTEEPKRAVMRHLSSLDEWFERTIIGGLPDESPATTSPSCNASLSSSAVGIDFSDLDELLEIKPSSVSPSVDLDTLTNELLELCVVPMTSKQSRTDTIDIILMPVGSQCIDEERSSDSSTTEWEDCVADQQVIERVTAIGDLDDNNASDRGIPDDFGAKMMKSEPEVSASEIEIAQLKSTIWRLKEALDAKDDMLSFLDGKLSYYEEMLGKHRLQQSLLDPNRNQTPRTAAYPRRR